MAGCVMRQGRATAQQGTVARFARSPASPVLGATAAALSVAVKTTLSAIQVMPHPVQVYCIYGTEISLNLLIYRCVF